MARIKDRVRNMRNRLVQADSRNLGFIEPESVDLVFTSPPYHDLKDYGYPEQIGHGMAFPEFLGNMVPVVQELERVLVPGGRMVLNLATICITRTKSGDVVQKEINLPGIFTDLVEKHTTLKRERHIVWHKVSRRSIPGAPYPLSVNIPFEIEYLTVYCKPGKREVDPEIRERSKLSEKDYQELAQSVWYVHRRKELASGMHAIHPCPFPPALAERVIKMYSFVGDWVLDPFCGIGNTCIAAARNRRDFLGIDLNIEYLLETKRRLKKMAGIEPVSLETV